MFSRCTVRALGKGGVAVCAIFSDPFLITTMPFTAKIYKKLGLPPIFAGNDGFAQRRVEWNRSDANR